MSLLTEHVTNVFLPSCLLCFLSFGWRFNFGNLGFWFPWSVVLLAVAVVFFTYVTVLVVRHKRCIGFSSLISISSTCLFSWLDNLSKWCQLFTVAFFVLFCSVFGKFFFRKKSYLFFLTTDCSFKFSFIFYWYNSIKIGTSITFSNFLSNTNLKQLIDCLKPEKWKQTLKYCIYLIHHHWNYLVTCNCNCSRQQPPRFETFTFCSLPHPQALHRLYREKE